MSIPIPIPIPIPEIQLTPGSQVFIANLSWTDFESILEDIGEKHRFPKSGFMIMAS